MIELSNNELVFSFPEVHPDARLRVSFQRTLRIPDDDRDHSLPPGLGRFPLRHVDDFSSRVPGHWMERGGVMLPMFQSEAMWLNFDSDFIGEHNAEYPFAVMIAAGKVNAVTGGTWQPALTGRPQDYVVVPEQPWLDGFCVQKGLIRQFVAMPLGDGYSAEEQLTGKAEHGGLQIMVFPMRRDAFNEHYPVQIAERYPAPALCIDACASPDMGLAPGGRMRQEIHEDPFDFRDWDMSRSSRCFTHLCNSLVWQAITHEAPPTTPPTARQYTEAGLPWFEYYSDTPALQGSDVLARLKSVLELGRERGTNPLPENAAVAPDRVIALRKGLARDQVREGSF